MRREPTSPDKSTPTASSPAARAVMRGNRSDSALERGLRSRLHRRGLRFRKHVNVVPGFRCKPDVVFTRARLAVFVHGCFWHSCPDHRSQPKANDSWWRDKLANTVARDQRNRAALEAAGWTVVELWEHQDLDEMTDEVVATLRGLQTAEVRPQAPD